MPRERKPENVIRELKWRMKRTDDELARTVAELGVYRQRATKAEQDAADWKRRFDALLERTPKVEQG